MSAAKPWWWDAAVYQIYVRSFADGNGDGVGDLEGIRSRLPYLADLGVDAVWITPFYRSPMADHGYDVADYRDVDPLFGSLDDIDKLLVDAHALGLRVIVDLVPNHTSSEHPWFRAALRDAASAYRDWYIFRPPAADGGPPNNWVSVFGGPAWTLDTTSGEYYLHLFDPKQPDLNWRNPEVHNAWEQILRFWLDRGVDGFRIDVAHGLYKHPQLADNPQPDQVHEGSEQYHGIATPNSWDQPEVHQVYRRWREICESYDGDRMMVGEVFLFDVDRVAAYVGPAGLHQAFNFTVMGTAFRAPDLLWVLRLATEKFLSAGSPPTWVLSNHDLARHATRYGGGAPGERRGRAVTAALMALPGSPYIYQGEELGLEQAEVPPGRRQDPIWERSGHTQPGRDGCRTPLPWTSQPPGFGFTTAAEAWLPFGSDAAARSVARQDGDASSTLEFYRRTLALRRSLRDRLDDAVTWLAGPDDVVGFRRRAHDGRHLVCLLNCGSRPVTIDVSGDAELVLSTAAAGHVAGGTAVVPAEATIWLTTTSLDAPSSYDMILTNSRNEAARPPLAAGGPDAARS